MYVNDKTNFNLLSDKIISLILHVSIIIMLYVKLNQVGDIENVDISRI